MNLLLLRHANADTYASTDLARPLSEKGRRQAAYVANFLKTYRAAPQVILSSTAVRAMETATPVAETLGIECLPCPWACPGMHPEEALHEIEAYAAFDTLILVGHQPDLSLLTASILNSPDASRFHLRKAALIHLSIPSPKNARLEAFIPCPPV